MRRCVTLEPAAEAVCDQSAVPHDIGSHLLRELTTRTNAHFQSVS